MNYQSIDAKGVFFTKKQLGAHIQLFLNDLNKENFTVSKVLLYGSYAKGSVTSNSDIDLAIWLKNKFITEAQETRLKAIAREHCPIHVKVFAMNETAEDDPFIEEIEKNAVPFTHAQND